MLSQEKPIARIAVRILRVGAINGFVMIIALASPASETAQRLRHKHSSHTQPLLLFRFLLALFRLQTRTMVIIHLKIVRLLNTGFPIMPGVQGLLKTKNIWYYLFSVIIFFLPKCKISRETNRQNITACIVPSGPKDPPVIQ